MKDWLLRLETQTYTKDEIHKLGKVLRLGSQPDLLMVYVKDPDNGTVAAHAVATRHKVGPRGPVYNLRLFWEERDI